MLPFYVLGALFLMVFIADFPYWKSVFTEPIRLHKIRKARKKEVQDE